MDNINTDQNKVEFYQIMVTIGIDTRLKSFGAAQIKIIINYFEFTVR